MGECALGCSSVLLATSATPLPAATISQPSGTGRSDYVAVSSTGLSPEGNVVSVVLHVAEGRLHELEVFDSDAEKGVAVDSASLVGARPARGRLSRASPHALRQRVGFKMIRLTG